MAALTIELKRARPGDEHLIARVYRPARMAAMPWLPVCHTPEEDLAFFRLVMIAQQHTELVYADGVLAGVFTSAPGWIEQFYLLEPYWRRGIGSMLIRREMERQDTLQLWTFTRNARAIAFYASHGFTEAERTDGSDNEEREPDIRFVWSRQS